MADERISVTYHLSFQKESVKRSVDLLLAEMTSGIQYVSTREGVRMDPVHGSLPYVDRSIRGQILATEQLDGDTYRVQYAIPLNNLDVGLGGISNLWPVVAGEVFNFHFIKSASLVELGLPVSFENYYLGPRCGIEGMRELLEVKTGPLFGSIIKPNIGLDPQRTAHVVELHAKAGFDFVKDDEICVNPALCPLEQRVAMVTEMVERVSQKTGKKILYAANVTTDFSVLGKAAEIAVKAGAGGLMIDPFCAGLSSIDYLRRNFDVPLYIHRVGYGLHCLGPTYNIRYEVFSKLFKLLGADFSHVGGIWGKSEEARAKTAGYLQILRNESSKNATWPVVTGISLENMADYYDFFGDDTLFMEHIDIYRDELGAQEKLRALKSKIEPKGERG